MAKRHKYHFLAIEQNGRGRSIVTLPGQMIGRKPLVPHILVRDIGSSTVLSRLKARCNTGDILFTTTLREVSNCYAARDAYPLKNNAELLYQDAQEEYDALISQQ